MKRDLTCIICPMGCQLEATLEKGRVTAVTGNTCPRGAEYARNECTNPQRTVTSTVRCADGRVLPVKTDRTIPKDKVMACMTIINAATPAAPVSVGDVIISDVFGANVVACRNLEAL